MSQLEASEQNIDEAIKYAIAATQSAPNDPATFLQAGLLFYGKKDYQNAVNGLQRALELDPNLAEAHTSMALISLSYEFDFAGAEKSLKRAIELDPNYATARQWYAVLLSGSRHDEAIKEIKKAVELDPFSLAINVWAVFVLERAGRYDEEIGRAHV